MVSFLALPCLALSHPVSLCFILSRSATSISSAFFSFLRSTSVPFPVHNYLPPSILLLHLACPGQLGLHAVCAATDSSASLFVFSCMSFAITPAVQDHAARGNKRSGRVCGGMDVKGIRQAEGRPRWANWAWSLLPTVRIPSPTPTSAHRLLHPPSPHSTLCLCPVL